MTADGDRVAYAVRRFGPDSPEARAASIKFCESIPIDPFYQHVIEPKVRRPLKGGVVPVNAAYKTEHEWQRVIRLIVEANR